ncbi:MAG TPA: ATP synthase subunit I [Steroidobacteraceae bacterium]
MPASIAVFAGVFLGALFFGGLWWTVRRGMTRRNPALWFSMSLVLRMSACLVGFYLVSAKGGPSLLLGLLGFVVARAVITRSVTRPGWTPHAP